MLRTWTAFRYIFFELLPSFFIGNLIFVFIILMFQGLRFTEFALVHGVSLTTLSQILGFMTISFLPLLLPMSLLFSVLLTYNRLSGDSEVVAFKASGLSLVQIISPALVLGIITSIFSIQISFELAPWGNRQFEILMSRLANSKAGITLKEGTFMDNFFDLVVYASKVKTETGEMEKVFLFDERQNPPMAIIAKSGQMIQHTNLGGNQVDLILKNGDIHRKEAGHTKINFGTFRMTMNEDYHIHEKDKTLQSLTMDEIKLELKRTEKVPVENRLVLSELHKRWAIAVACLIFALIGTSLGTSTNKRSASGSGMILCIIVIVVYSVLYVVAESSVRSSAAPVMAILWAPNLLFMTTAFVGLYRLRR